MYVLSSCQLFLFTLAPQYLCSWPSTNNIAALDLKTRRALQRARPLLRTFPSPANLPAGAFLPLLFFVHAPACILLWLPFCKNNCLTVCLWQHNTQTTHTYTHSPTGQLCYINGRLPYCPRGKQESHCPGHYRGSLRVGRNFWFARFAEGKSVMRWAWLARVQLMP